MVEEAINLTQNYILKLQIWLTKQWIASNNERTHVIVFRKTRSHNSPPPLQILNNTIEWTFEINYLGLIIKDNLTYRPHFEETTKKILEVLLSKRHYQQEIKLSLKNRLFVHKQYLRPLLLYACPIWGSAGTIHIDNLQHIQNRAIRTIARAPLFLPRYILHEELRVEPIHTLIAELASRFHSSIPYHYNMTINTQNPFRNLPPSTHRMLHRATTLQASF
ncbi:putative RNA-directed DNA polymerase from transposon BS [Trichonephila clavipes]|nr:putative RNA-directed DNA polymerase from transposon BS [Trichonephila clavipes]